MAITANTYNALEKAYDFFNVELFNGKLPPCLITLAYHKTAYGYFRDQAFKSRGKKSAITDEIALNPFHFHTRDDRAIFSTLVHEMVHLWQHRFAKPSKTHHNAEWANEMERLGLMPSSTAAPGGKRTGRRVSHYIIEGGAYDRAYKRCKIQLDWQGFMIAPQKKARKRVKYCCPSCDLNAYGKAGLNLICADCDEPLEAA